ncbi:MAG TPA: hypothetical protein VMT89_16460, partial [Candidatus Acidoferrales bacterium]|nr:hypothetical protein [Candidatus Acidoferrales bacterium]
GREILEIVHPGIWFRRLAVGGAAAVLLGLVIRQAAILIQSSPSPRETNYRKAVELLGPAAQDPNVLIGALEIGTIGYFSRARILDHFGLVSPEVPALDLADVLDRYHPDYFIGQYVLMTLTGFLATPAFHEHYKRFDAVTGGLDSLTIIYVRHD